MWLTAFGKQRRRSLIWLLIWGVEDNNSKWSGNKRRDQGYYGVKNEAGYRNVEFNISM